MDGSEAPAADAAIDRISAALDAGAPCPPFAHLLLHADDRGWYVPQDFAAPIRGDAAGEFAESLWTVGSVPRLVEELNAVAAALGVPEGVDFDDAAVMAEVDAALQDAAEAPAWLAQPVAV